MVLNQILLLIPKEKRDFEQNKIKLSLNPVELQIFLQMQCKEHVCGIHHC